MRGSKKFFLKFCVGLFAIVLLSACDKEGGGSSTSSGDSSDEEVSSDNGVLDLAFELKTFVFTWDDVEDAGYYHLYENPDGYSGYTQIGGDIPAGTETFSHEVALYQRVNASYLLEGCSGTTCEEIDTLYLSGNLEDAIGYFKASDTSAGDAFGSAIALSGDGETLAVGAYQEDSDATGIDGEESDDNEMEETGAVYVFTLSDGEWTQEAYIKASNTDSGDQFGIAVALSDDGDTLVVGANMESSVATGIGGDETDDSVAYAGAAYVFSRNDGEWTQEAYIKASNTGTYDYFGHALGLSADGNTLVIGAAGEASSSAGINGNQLNDSMSGSGAVYVFARSAGSWTQQAYIKASNTDPQDYFGYALSLSADGNVLAVGAYREDSNATGIGGDESDNNANQAGAVYVFTRSGSDWNQQAYLKASNAESNDYFGIAVGLSADGSTLAVGAEREDGAATGINGYDADNSLGASGAVYVFSQSGGSWAQEAYVKASNTDGEDHFGHAVSLSQDGSILAVGAYEEDSGAVGIEGDDSDETASGAGAVFVFFRDIGVWSQQAYVKASNTGVEDYFGDTVSIAADGSILVAGAPGEDGSDTGVDADSNSGASGSGAVYLF